MDRSRSGFALGLVVLLVVLGGCAQDDPRPKIAPAESTPTASPSPTRSTPPLSPEDTVRAWVKAQNQAMRTGDTSRVRALSSEPCEACDGLIDPIEKVYSAGGYFKTKGWKVAGLKESRGNSKDAIVNSALVIRGGTTLNAAGENPVTYGVERSMVRFKLVRDRGRWLVSFIGFLS